MYNRNKIAVSLLILSFTVSLLTALVNGRNYSRISFKYYNELSGKLVTEDRFVLLKGNSDERAIIVLEELLLGPHSVFNRKLVPFNQKYNSFIIRDKVAYLDMPVEFILDYNDSKFSLQERTDLIKKNLISNIKKINSVNLTIDGYLMNNGPLNRELPQATEDNKK